MADLSKVNWKGPQPAPRYLSHLLRANFPQIKQIGIYNDRYIAGTTIKSAHAEGRAIDFHLSARDPEQRGLADQLVVALIRNARQLGIDNVIWNRQIWSVRYSGPRPYKGQNPHTDHVHAEFTREGSQQLMLPAIDVEIAVIRSGLEDLYNANRNLA
jgi:hypothetical protein